MCRRRSKKDPEAALALKEAKSSLQRVKSREKEVHDVVEASREFRRKNHFADQLSVLFTPPISPPGKDRV